MSQVWHLVQLAYPHFGHHSFLYLYEGIDCSTSIEVYIVAAGHPVAGERRYSPFGP